jgi:hypothetical protein
VPSRNFGPPPVCLAVVRLGAIYATAVLVALLAWASGSAAQSRHNATVLWCPRDAAHVIAADANAAVYEPTPGVLLGCVHGQEHEYSLSRGAHPGESTVFKALAGSVVAVERYALSRENQLLIVTELRTGQVMRKVHTGGPPSTPCLLDCDGLALPLVLKPDGSLAWITSDNRYIRRELHEVDKTGSRILAAWSGGYAESSLFIRGGTLYWTEEGRSFSAPFD